MEAQRRGQVLAVLMGLVMLMVGCARTDNPAKAAPEGTVELRIVATVPPKSGDVYVAGNLPELGPWNPGQFAMKGRGTRREALLHVAPGTEVKYKFTRGSWETEALAADGSVPPDNTVRVDKATTVEHAVARFREVSPEDLAAKKLLGRLVTWPQVKSKHLGPARDVDIWLPPGYRARGSKRYPVIYMHDGQNLFPRPGGGTDWGVDKSIDRLVSAGKVPPAIVVAIHNTDRRLQEYHPFNDGPAYGRFLVEELKPRVDAEFRTLPDRAHTATMGSSRGGTVALYLLQAHPDVFGAAACLSISPSVLPPDPPEMIRTWLREVMASDLMTKDVRLYVDYDAPVAEGSPLAADMPSTRGRLKALMDEWTWPQTDRFVLRGVPDRHNEGAWRARLDEPMEFLLAPMK